MSYRDMLRPEQRPAYDAAIAAAAGILASAASARDEMAAAGGPEAVAAQAAYPGHLAAGQIARQYQRMQDEARRKGAAA